jgi:lipoate synthase
VQQKASQREIEIINRRVAEVNAETWAIERETEVRLGLIRKQVEMEKELAVQIREIAERSALSVLDRIKEASDSMLDWAGLMADDMSGMMKQEASEQVARKASDIRAIEDAIEDEERTIEMLGLAARYKGHAA